MWSHTECCACTIQGPLAVKKIFTALSLRYCYVVIIHTHQIYASEN